MKKLFNLFICTYLIINTGYAQINSSILSNPSLPPQPVNGVTIPKDYAKTVARAAYIWGWPMANLFNRRATITQAQQPSLMNGVLPAAPLGQIAMLTDYIKPEQTFVACPNQDVVYGRMQFTKW